MASWSHTKSFFRKFYASVTDPPVFEAEAALAGSTAEPSTSYRPVVVTGSENGVAENRPTYTRARSIIIVPDDGDHEDGGFTCSWRKFFLFAGPGLLMCIAYIVSGL